MTNVHKVELLIIDFDDDLEDGDIKEVIENTSFANHCMSPEVKNIETRQIVWSDEHPLNSSDPDISDEAYSKLFSK